LEYGTSDLLENKISDPSELRIARMANGATEVLSDFSIDLSQSMITAFYSPQSASLGLDQFGEFALVEPVPEPSSIAVFGAATLSLLGCARRRRCSKSPQT